MDRLSTDHLRECMEPTMEKTSYRLNYMYPLLNRVDKQLYDFMETYVLFISVNSVFLILCLLENLLSVTDISKNESVSSESLAQNGCVKFNVGS